MSLLIGLHQRDVPAPAESPVRLRDLAQIVVEHPREEAIRMR